MASTEFNLNYSWQDLLASAEKLTGKDFEAFFEALTKIKANRRGPSLPKRESELLEKINSIPPTSVLARIDEMRKTSKSRLFSEEEEKEFDKLIEQVENHGAKRIGWLNELAEIRGISVHELMNQLDIQAPFDA